MDNFIELIDIDLKVSDNFDIVKRQLIVSSKVFTFYFVDGFVKDEILEKMMEFFLKDISYDLFLESIDVFANKTMPYIEVEIIKDLSIAKDSILSGSLVLHIEGYQDVICIDARTYPIRGMQEPEDDRVLRGSRDGFVETIIFNTALIRRRIRDEKLMMTHHSVGNISKTDIVLCYLEGKVEQSLLKRIADRLNEIDVGALTMSQESLAETLVEGKWYSPFPKVRYTERPDVASSNILEGKIILIIDNSPNVIILPTYFFDFVQEAQDYYMPPVIGTYLRIVRILVFISTLLITPLWYFLNLNPMIVPSSLEFLILKDVIQVPIIIQFLILEFAIDALKLASLNTPSALSGSFSILGALLLGDFAVKAGWFNSEIILYMAYVALANFTQPSYELGYAVKFCRILLLILIFVLPEFGIYVGLFLMFVILYRSKTISKQSYLYPLIPFNYKEFIKIFKRSKLRSKGG